MRNNKKFKSVFLAIFALLLTNSICVSAQGSLVKPLSDFLTDYKEKNHVISEEIKEMTDISFAEKLALYENKVAKIKESFKNKRKEEYLSKSITRAKRFNCEGTHVRKATKCLYEVKAPNENMYTKKDWIEIKGTDVPVSVNTDDYSTKIGMTVSGKKKIDLTVYATFKYKSESIPSMVDKDMLELFDQIHIE